MKKLMILSAAAFFGAAAHGQNPIVQTCFTGGWEQWRTFDISELAPVSGIHDLYLVFRGRKGPKLFNLDWWEIN